MVSINIIQGKMYYIIKKITIVVVALTIFSIVFFTITLIWWRGDYSWEDMQLEYVGQMSYQYPGAVQELGIPPITVNAYNIKRVLETPEDDKIRNFFQIRSKADWEYVKEVLGVNNMMSRQLKSMCFLPQRENRMPPGNFKTRWAIKPSS